jgi:hypothetical protein
MRRAIVVVLLALVPAVAHGESSSAAAAALRLEVGRRPSALDLDTLFDSVIGAARLGVSSGKIVLTRRRADGRREEVALALGRTRLVPLFDVSLGQATAIFRIRF